MVSKKALNTLLVGAVAATGAMAVSSTAQAIPDGTEKCYGVVKAGMNGCGNAQGTHSCAGQAKADGDWGEWLALPKGTCEKIVGASLKPMKPAADHGDHAGDKH